MPLVNIVKGNHIFGALIGAAISAPTSAWVAYGFIKLTGFDFDPLGNPAWLITGITALMALYVAIAFGVCWAVGGDYESYKRRLR